MEWGHVAFYAGVALVVVGITGLTGDPLVGLIVGWLILHAPLGLERLAHEVDAAHRLGRMRPGCVKCERLPQNPTRAVLLAHPVRTPMRYRYFTNSFRCPDCGSEEYWAAVLRRRGIFVPEGCVSLADMLTERTT